MPWSLDWFSAEALARNGAKIRRAGWMEHWLEKRGAIYVSNDGVTEAVVKAVDFGSAEFNARDWTDQPSNANPCAATPAYNSKPVSYRQWTEEPVQLPPPVPGFVSP